jgi:hypothetical protein
MTWIRNTGIMPKLSTKYEAQIPKAYIIGSQNFKKFLTKDCVREGDEYFVICTLFFKVLPSLKKTRNKKGDPSPLPNVNRV